MEFAYEKIERKKSLWQDLLCLFFAIYFLFFPNIFFKPRPVWALTENAGTDFTLCTAGAELERNGENIDVTFLWVFDSQQNDYFDDDGLPLNPEGGNSIDTPIMAASTQVSYWLEVDDNSDFSSPEIQTGEVVSDAQYHFYNGGGLSVTKTWNWRLMVKDSYDSVTDWVSGGSFSFNSNIHLKGDIKLKGETRFQFP
jgi:hypothetical protein